MAEAIQGARLDEPLDRGIVDDLGIDALAEIEEVRKAAALGAARTISSDEPRPTPLMAVKPKVILPSWTPNSLSLWLTLGGSTSTPILRASAM